MSFYISTQVRNDILIALAASVNGGIIKIYGDPVSAVAADALVPASSDASIGSATLLCTISSDGAGTGINMDNTPVNGILNKNAAESWYGTNEASGYASFYRYAAIADDGSATTTAVRVQGTVDILNADIIISSKYLTISEEQRLDSYYLGMPASV